MEPLQPQRIDQLIQQQAKAAHEAAMTKRLNVILEHCAELLAAAGALSGGDSIEFSNAQMRHEINPATGMRSVALTFNYRPAPRVFMPAPREDE